jgi:hypothetical protein
MKEQTKYTLIAGAILLVWLLIAFPRELENCLA